MLWYVMRLGTHEWAMVKRKGDQNLQRSGLRSTCDGVDRAGHRVRHCKAQQNRQPEDTADSEGFGDVGAVSSRINPSATNTATPTEGSKRIGRTPLGMLTTTRQIPRLLPATVPPTSAGRIDAGGSSTAYQIDDRVQDDPHDIDKTPV